MKTIGETLRQIRKDKGLTLQDLATSGVSATFISKVERNESHIGLHKFEALLTGLHVSYDEFKYLQNDYSQDAQSAFLDKLDGFVRNENLYGLQRLSQNEKMLIPKKNPEKSVHFHNMTLALCHLRKFQGKSLPAKYQHSLVTYLLAVDSWGVYELRLFNNALFLFDRASLISLTQTAFNRATSYLQLPGYADLQASILSNALELLIEEHEFAVAQKLLAKTQPRLNFERPTQAKIKIVFLAALLAASQHASSVDPTSPEDIIAACYALKAVNWSNALTHYLQDWQKTTH